MPCPQNSNVFKAFQYAWQRPWRSCHIKGHQVDTWRAGLNEESQGSMQNFFARPCQYSSTLTINMEYINWSLCVYLTSPHAMRSPVNIRILKVIKHRHWRWEGLQNEVSTICNMAVSDCYGNYWDLEKRNRTTGMLLSHSHQQSLQQH